MTDVNLPRVLVIGSGPIVIGQAAEFDYAGTQACKTLKAAGYYVILVNSNPATIMTDIDVADSTYIEPLTTMFIEKIIQQESPAFILPTLGGQTALNCVIDLANAGILDKYSIKIIGITLEAIKKAENRELFNQIVQSIGLNVAKNFSVCDLTQAMTVLSTIGLPAIIRPSFTLGGSGSGIAYTEAEFKQIVTYGLSLSPIHEVVIDQSLLGWKEYELELLRDKNGNTIVVCSIENIDPMGVHTGDSITVAPALTLCDKEYQKMRNAAINILAAVGVNAGGANVQFAVNPTNGELIVVEMNPRVSRSSALASKVTGFPIAKIATKLAIGQTLDIALAGMNIAFEPALDYVVVKIPRFAFEVFGTHNDCLTTAMKSVGEVMAIGTNFAQALQKALRALDIGLTGFNAASIILPTDNPKQFICDKLTAPNSMRLLYIAAAFQLGFSIAEINALTHIDNWFLYQMHNIVQHTMQLTHSFALDSRSSFITLKKLGFSDAAIAEATKLDIVHISDFRRAQQIHPVYRAIDSCAAEFTVKANYLYSCYVDDGVKAGKCDSIVSINNKVIILGSGSNKIGQGIEFDYVCCRAAKALKRHNIDIIMINCNPETISTDADTSDKLYFDALYAEDVLAIIHHEQRAGKLLGVAVQFGGQTSLKLAYTLSQQNIPIFGTSFLAIDMAEDRGKFKQVLANLAIRQPTSVVCNSLIAVQRMSHELAYPVLIRPSNVLGGKAMAIIRNSQELADYGKKYHLILDERAILVDEFLENAIEFDVDAVCDGQDIYIAGIMEHVEFAGIHSGDSACILPATHLTTAQRSLIHEQTLAIALHLGVYGLLNMQYAIYKNELYLLEANPRASRTMPFVSKITGINLIDLAVDITLGSKLQNMTLQQPKHGYYAIKESVFPVARFNTDVWLGPEMRSTGEVLGIDADSDIAFAKAQIAAYNFIMLKPQSKVLLLINDNDSVDTLAELYMLCQSLKLTLYTSERNFLRTYNISMYTIAELELMVANHIIDFAILTDHASNEYNLRRLILLNRVPYCTTLNAALRYLIAQQKFAITAPTVQSLQSLHSSRVII